MPKISFEKAFLNSSGAKDFAKTTNLSPLLGAFNHVVFMVGTALVATGYSFSLTNPYLGVVTDLVLGIWASIASVCLIYSSIEANATSFIDLARKAFGNVTFGHKLLQFFFCSLPSLILCIGALAAYITIASSALESYIGVDPKIIQSVLSVFIFFLGSINSFNNSKYISAVTAFIAIFIVIVMNYTGIRMAVTLDEFQPQRPFEFLEFIQAIPVLAFGLTSHVGIPGMIGEMKPKFRKSFPKYLVIAQFIIIICNSSLGFIPALIYGRCTQSDSMIQMHCMWQLEFGGRSVLIILAQICLGVALISQAPLFVIPLKEIFLDFGGKTVRDRSVLINIVSSFIITLVAAVLGIALGNVTDIINVAGTIGGLLILGPTAGIFSFILEKSTWSKIRATIVTIAGLISIAINIFTIVQTFIPQTDTQDYLCLCEQ